MTANGAGTTSSLFRTLERYKGTVYIDEADISYSDTENDMVKFYNLGAMRDNPIWRTIEMTGPDGEKVWEAVSFQTFCPKLVAMRKEFKDDAVGSRSLTIHLQPREMTELVAAGIPLSINQTIRGKAEALRNMLVRFRLETWQPDIEIDQSLYDLTISARLNQVAGPLLAMAKDDDAQREDIKTTLREYYRESILNMSDPDTTRPRRAPAAAGLRVARQCSPGSRSSRRRKPRSYPLPRCFAAAPPRSRFHRSRQPRGIRSATRPPCASTPPNAPTSHPRSGVRRCGFRP